MWKLPYVGSRLDHTVHLFCRLDGVACNEYMACRFTPRQVQRIIASVASSHQLDTDAARLSNCYLPEQ